MFNSAIAFLAITSEHMLELSSATFIAVLLLGIFAIPLLELYNKKEEPFSNIAHSLFPILYIALPFGLLIYANSEFPNYPEEYSAELILGFYFILWSNDTGAYLSGKAFGKHKLFERISPNKTWQGSIGGGFLAIGISVLMSIIFNCIPIWQWIVIGVIISIFGSMGDLVQSMFKRSMNVKDGMAIREAIKKGYLVAIISGGKSQGLIERFKNLKINDVYLACDDKKDALSDLMHIHELDSQSILYMGDDINDWEIMKEVGLSSCPQDAVPEIKAIADYISHKNGGQGCVRDVIEQTLKVQGKWSN
mgnify:CR=1 FL=1